MLEYLEEEGQSIEPTYYVPTVPLALINGADGIGTGWSTDVPPFNPRDIVANLRGRMAGRPFERMHPWFKNFRGEVQPNGKGYTVKGVYKVVGDNELEITELPVKKWTRDYKSFLEELAEKEKVDEISEYHTENRVHFIVGIPGVCGLADSALEKNFKLSSSLATSNLVLFSSTGQIRRYADEREILEEFYSVRETLYQRRKDYLIRKLRKEHALLENKVRFILGVIEDEIRVQKKRRKEVVAMLSDKGFATITEINAILGE